MWVWNAGFVIRGLRFFWNVTPANNKGNPIVKYIAKNNLILIKDQQHNVNAFSWYYSDLLYDKSFWSHSFISVPSWTYHSDNAGLLLELDDAWHVAISATWIRHPLVVFRLQLIEKGNGKEKEKVSFWRTTCHL